MDEILVQQADIYDVIVVGSGLAGLTAAIASAEAGCRTIIIEKMTVVGGSSALSLGAFAVCCSPAQRKANIDDSSELFYNDIMTCGENHNIPILVKALASNSASAFKFIKDRGAEYGERLFSVDGHSVKRCFQPAGGLGENVIRPLKNYFLNLPQTTLQLNTKVTGLLRFEGAVTGVETDRGKYYARKGVVFAHGGFEHDVFFQRPEMAKYSNIPTSTHSGADSETLRMLIAEGMKAYQTEFLRFGTSIAYNDIDKGVLVDIRSCHRLITEPVPRRILTEKIIEIAEGSYWPVLIFDSNGIDSISNDEKLELMAASGELQKFANLNELALFFGMDSAVLSENFSEKDNIPPFYACVVYPKLNYTQGGVLIDENARVIDIDGHPVRNLYAAGEATGGVHGKVRLTGCSTVDCCVFGIIAGRNAANGMGF